MEAKDIALIFGGLAGIGLIAYLISAKVPTGQPKAKIGEVEIK